MRLSVVSSGRIEKVPIDWTLVASVLGGIALGWAILWTMHGSSDGAAYVPDVPDVAVQTVEQR